MNLKSGRRMFLSKLNSEIVKPAAHLHSSTLDPLVNKNKYSFHVVLVGSKATFLYNMFWFFFLCYLLVCDLKKIKNGVFRCHDGIFF
jgi:hypothetical protein